MPRHKSEPVPRSTHISPEPSIRDEDEASADGDDGELIQILNKATEVSRKRKRAGSKLGSPTPRPSTASQLQRPVARPGNLVKIKNYPPTPDIYTIPQDEADEADEPSPKRFKRSQSNPKADAHPMPNRTRSGKIKIVSINEPTPTSSKPAHKEEGLASNDPPKPKRGRGRPRKHEPKPIPSNDVANAEVALYDQDIAEAEVIVNGQNVAEAEAEAAVDDQDVSEVEDMVCLNIEERSSHSSRDTSPVVGNGTGPNDASEVELVDLNIYQKMLKTLGHIRAGPEENADIQLEKGSRGKEYLEALKKELISIKDSYFSLRTAKTNRKSREIRNLQRKAKDSIKVIGTMAIELHLKEPAVLAGVYLDIMPNFVKVIMMCVDAHTNDDEDISMASMAEIAGLLKIAYDLGAEAVKQPVSLQPMTAEGTYYARRPTLKTLPRIRERRRAFTTALRERRKARERAELEEIVAEQQRELEERRQEEARKSLEDQAALNNLHRKQRHALDMNMADPRLAEWVKREVAGDATQPNTRREETVHKSRTREAPGTTRPSSILEPVQNHRRAIEDRNERDGAPQKPENTGVPDWSYEAQVIFIETMRSEPGDDRYTKVAERIGCSLDEVFICAKEFQEAMDFEHENGRLNEPGDEWSYSAWVEPARDK